MKISKIIACIAVLLMLMLPALANTADAATQDKSTSGCQVRVQHNSSLASICDVVLIGVGTAMGTKDYDNLAKKIDNYGYVIVIMDHGRIIAQGSPAELVGRYCSGATITLPRDSIRIALQELPFPYREINGRIEIMTDKVKTGMEKLLALNIDLAEMTVRSPNLEDVFLNLTGRKLRD